MVAQAFGLLMRVRPSIDAMAQRLLASMEQDVALARYFTEAQNTRAGGHFEAKIAESARGC